MSSCPSSVSSSLKRAALTALVVTASLGTVFTGRAAARTLGAPAGETAMMTTPTPHVHAAATERATLASETRGHHASSAMKLHAGGASILAYAPTPYEAPPATAGGGLAVRVAAADGSGERELFAEDGVRASRVQYVEPGYLLYVRDHAAVARPFDPVRRELAGEPRVIAEGSGVWGAGHAVLSASANGVLVHGNIRDLTPSQLTWLGRDGRELARLGPPGPLYAFDLSPDGRRVVIERVDALGEDALWVMDAERGTSARLTSEIGAWRGVWSPDGRHVAYCSGGPPALAVPVVGGN